jgi:hypothetical protein
LDDKNKEIKFMNQEQNNKKKLLIEEIIEYILKYLKTPEILKMMKLNKKMYKCCQSNSLWKTIFENSKFKDSNKIEEIYNLKSIQYKEVYQNSVFQFKEIQKLFNSGSLSPTKSIKILIELNYIQNDPHDIALFLKYEKGKKKF